MSAKVPGHLIGNPVWWPGLHGFYGLSSGTQAGTAGRVFLTPLWIPRSAIISRISINVSTAGGASTSLRLGLYNDNGGTPDGGALLEDSGNIAATSTGVKTFTLGSQRYLEAGLYWLAYETEDGIIVVNRHNGTAFFTEIGDEKMQGCHYDRGGGFGALTDPCPSVTANNSANIAFRIRLERMA